MISKIIQFFFGDMRQRNLKRVRPLVDQVNIWCDQYDALNEEELKGKTTEFRARLAEGVAVDDLLPEAFGAVKQACKRLVGSSWEAGGISLTWNDVPFDEQICGAIYLHQGFVTEMATGEGKTLTASMPLYLNALEGKGAHLVTVNDYLARRDSEWIGKVYNLLGMTVGAILTDMTPEERRVAYNSDITYGTNNEFGFDYLRDNMAWYPEQLVHRGYHYAIVDEVDSVLIDEARTPLIISGQVDRSTHRFDQLKPLVYTLVQKQAALVGNYVAEAEKLLEEAGEGASNNDERRYRAGIRLLQARIGMPKHKRFMKIAGEGAIQRLIDRVEADYMRDKKMKEVEEELFFNVDEKGHTIDLTEKGRTTISPEDPEIFLLKDIVEEFAAIEGRTELSQEEREKLKEEAMTQHEIRAEELHNISQLLRAYALYERDKEYVIQDNKVIIVDEFTGRLMAGRRWSDGLHQAVEAKEGVAIEKETQTLATITLQNYFRMYKKLAGMTGTAETEAAEFTHTYKMNVSVIPTHRPLRRQDFNDLIYKTQREKYNAIVQEVQRLNNEGMPVLVGTTSVDVSEKLSIMLRRAKVSHSVLNAKYHEREAQIVSGAGQRGAVTIATNMAGRGTDIKLGPGVLRCGDDGTNTWCSGCAHRAPAGAKVDKNKIPCGLQIIGSERHEARRIDRQLRGRAGRQGDPGSSRFFVSLEDDLMRLFASEKMASLMSRGFQEGEAMEHGLATRAIASAQKKIEGINFEQRKRTLDYDNVMNKQREAIYGVRRRTLLAEGDNGEEVLNITAEAIYGEWTVYCEGTEAAKWDVHGFLDWVRRSVPFIDLRTLYDVDPHVIATDVEEFLDKVVDCCTAVYTRKSEALGGDIMNAISRYVLLNVIDTHWRDHLLAIDELREGIGLRGYGQLDPLVEYQREATNLFEEMMGNVYKEIFEKVFRMTVVQDQANPGSLHLSYVKEEGRQGVADTLRSAAPKQPQGQAYSDNGDGASGGEERPKPVTYRRQQPKVGPNQPCPCGSGKKYKKCHGAPGAHGPLAVGGGDGE